ncbi:uncharacterized protein LOC123612446 isoform X1 [Camelus bactrianus]|uniref:Uncharacterized protein LOC123612446 isoform X1 n=2 Tax=Camelus bactrianus TaxID=9837 RepID=A0AC58QFT9_CAMBA|nr:uncharacterized protein LOC123612446 isoform X1 [Camelus bactrianus]
MILLSKRVLIQEPAPRERHTSVQEARGGEHLLACCTGGKSGAAAMAWEPGAGGPTPRAQALPPESCHYNWSLKAVQVPSVDGRLACGVWWGFRMEGESAFVSALSFTPSGACGCPLLLHRTAGNQVWMETGGVVVPRDNPGGLEGLGRIVDLYPYSSAPMALRTHGQEYLRRTYLTNAQPNKLFPVAEKVAVKDLDGGAATLNSLDDLRRRLPFPRFLGENLPLGLDILVLEGGGALQPSAGSLGVGLHSPLTWEV